MFCVNEELNKAASDFVRKNAVVKGQPNLTSHSFSRWVNQSLLPNSILDPGYTRSISVETGHKWLHKLGFDVLDKKKDVYIDGHERDDVVQHHQRFLYQMVSGGFLSHESAPSEEACSAFPDDLEPPSVEQRHKNIFIFHDESTFNANDDENLLWGMHESQIICPKSHGSGIIVPNFIKEKDRYLCLMEEDYIAACKNDPSLTMATRTLLEYRESHDGY